MTEPTRREKLIALRDSVEAGEPPDAGIIVSALGRGNPSDTALVPLVKWACDPEDIRALGAAKALHESVLPGWGWRVAICSVSDDAWVFPDFNCPVHGPRLRETLDEETDWVALTDQDIRPPGNPARAWLLAIFTALIELEPAP
jgi:hypothetical protein